MKKQVTDYIKSLGGQVSFSGKGWPTIAYISHLHADKEWLLTQIYKRFTRHTQIVFR